MDGAVLATFRRIRSPIIRANITIIIFVTVHLLVYIFFMVDRALVLFKSAAAKRSYDEWTECAFLNFDDDYPNQWMDICGELPSYRLPYSASIIGLLALTGYGIWMSAFHFSSISGDLSARLSAELWHSQNLSWEMLCLRWCVPSILLQLFFDSEIVDVVQMPLDENGVSNNDNTSYGLRLFNSMSRRY
jgi:hypothetical protein